MFPFGSYTTKTLDVSFGEFLCPHCKATTTYKHKERVKIHRSYMFLTVIGDTLEEYVECLCCKNRYMLDILREKIAPQSGQMLATLRQKLEEGASIQETESKLLESGFEMAMVKRYVSVAAGINLKKCLPCGLTYRGEVTKCRKCGHMLPAGRGGS